MRRTGLVEVVSEAGVAWRRAVRRRAWFRRRLGNSRGCGSDRWTAMAEQDLNRTQVGAGFVRRRAGFVQAGLSALRRVRERIRDSA
jgi:hypothetical protein